jgi:hypothetical protein
MGRRAAERFPLLLRCCKSCRLLGRRLAATMYGSQAAHVSLQDLGSIGEFVAAIATVETLAYVAVQVRQNTRALRSSTFQGIAEDMSRTAETIATHLELSALMVKASSISPPRRELATASPF